LVGIDQAMAAMRRYKVIEASVTESIRRSKLDQGEIGKIVTKDGV
jgi:hypothetical protein